MNAIINLSFSWLSIVLNIFALFGFIGSIINIVTLSGQKRKAKMKETPASSHAKTATDNSAELPPFKALLLKKNTNTVINFESSDGEMLELNLIDIIYLKGNGSVQLFAILQRASDDVIYIAQYDETHDALFLSGSETAERVFQEWKKEISTAARGTGGRLKLDLYDTIVYKSDWKAFKKRASQDELFALAVGSRYQLDGAKFYIRSLLGAVGGVLSIVLAFILAEDFGLFAIIGGVAGYLFFNLMASKQIGYADTLSDCRNKLNSENRQRLKDIFTENILLTLLRQIVLMMLTFVTIPYKFILIIIETFIPAARNWAVAHGGEAGAVISMPKGYDIGGLGTLGAYYASQKFGDVWEQHLKEVEAAKLAKFKKYTYTDKYGMQQEAYSDDGKTFYEGTNKLKIVGTSKDGGNTIDIG